MDIFDLAWDVSQQNELQKHSQELESTRGKLNTAEREIAYLHRRMDAMKVAMDALVSVLAQKFDVTAQDIRQAVEQQADTAKNHVGTCRRCDHVSRGHRMKCMYCGAPLEP